jgi:hypothetical protein
VSSPFAQIGAASGHPAAGDAPTKVSIDLGERRNADSANPAFVT